MASWDATPPRSPATGTAATKEIAATNPKPPTSWRPSAPGAPGRGFDGVGPRYRVEGSSAEAGRCGRVVERRADITPRTPRPLEVAVRAAWIWHASGYRDGRSRRIAAPSPTWRPTRRATRRAGRPPRKAVAARSRCRRGLGRPWAPHRARPSTVARADAPPLPRPSYTHTQPSYPNQTRTAPTRTHFTTPFHSIPKLLPRLTPSHPAPPM